LNDRGELVFALTGHMRAWDIHFWRNPDVNRTPVVAMNEPFGRLPRGTLDLAKGAFFYPDYVPPRRFAWGPVRPAACRS
jgi:hypothetical protein